MQKNLITQTLDYSTKFLRTENICLVFIFDVVFSITSFQSNLIIALMLKIGCQQYFFFQIRWGDNCSFALFSLHRPEETSMRPKPKFTGAW